jgi:hypothetical protein
LGGGCVSRKANNCLFGYNYVRKREEVMGRFRAGLVSGFWAFSLFVAVFGVVLNVPVVRAGGTIYIRANGTGKCVE